MTPEQFESQANYLGRQQVPFLFIVDFEMQKPLLFELDKIDNDLISYSVNGVTNASSVPGSFVPSITPVPTDSKDYAAKFNHVLANLENGNSYLTNLTIRTEIISNASLDQIFGFCKAKYKLLLKDQFLVFSPETFVQTQQGKIFSFPMKGTIDAMIPDAERIIMEDAKELAEHVTIVDLIRNDLSLVADSVTVNRFRYIDKLSTNRKQLLQVSSEVSGNLLPEYMSNPGSLLVKLLPAGSVSGAPKRKTVQIIQEAEKEKRGYYTGVFGIFNGRDIDSGVMIRFIERSGSKFYYRSGGGITTQSDCDSEFKEALNKIYVPVD